MDMYMLLYLKWITTRGLLSSTGNSARHYVAAWMGGEFGGKWIHVYVWLSPFAVHLKLSQHCQSTILLSLPTPVFLPGESHGQRTWTGYSPCHKESDMTEAS